MKSLSGSLLLGVSVLLLSELTVSAVSLGLSPNLQQFFSGDSVSLSCVEDGQTGGGWTVKRTRGNQTEDCGAAGSGSGSSCILSSVSPSDSGLYWCGTSSGLSSDWINISVSDGPFILEIPALPVLTGSDVTLCCRARNASTVEADLHKNGEFVAAGGNFTIRKVQQSDEGLYWCHIDLSGSSPQSRLRVKDPPPTTSDPPTSSSSSSSSSSNSAPPPGSQSSSSLFIPVSAALGSVVLLVLVVVLMLLLWRKHKGPDEVTYSHVIIRGQRSAGETPAQSSEPDVVYSSVRSGN
ncbi:basement membrane-specific heparan sulfate proteoglycan core protein-like isoform X2 [Mastacembelus armatus]|uniref:basement membrane-specific heparan sulfate proteoglycan core protein-like isoform X2 n=1 Tax=Mastacembelus armatus TaxID=205130 RepID=UPI000E463E20|nr:basement membrane-specific heparan sulfate proteoglycan core protein-like isoform X2 [Mastacembelus armatus]